MAFSRGERSRKGTSVRTPMARQTSVISDHISEFHGATAPWSMVSPSSGTNVARSTSRICPVPWHRGQAPPPLKAKSSAPGGWKVAPQVGQTSGRSAATSSEGGTAWPFGHRCSARRENIRRRLLSSSVPVPNVLRMPGTPGRWRRARAAGTCRASATSARAACVIRRRVYVESASK